MYRVFLDNSTEGKKAKKNMRTNICMLSVNNIT